ncbi:transmembrane protein 150C [Embiotoca jacksoni]|uniref:transmembrane protein 150C n=1 Tax=Embiotoca jacksoni TaxID=100190 RepID=UPI0037041FAB
MWTCRMFWALLPPVYSVCVAAGLWLVYFIAVYYENITPLTSQHRRRNGSMYPPYISIAGNFPPVSCIFSEVMNLAAFGGFVIAVLRYVQLRNKVDKPWLNVCSLVVFSIACFGMTIVGNFQLFTQESIHNWGSGLTFVPGLAFCWVQSYITLRVNLRNEGRRVAAVRFLLSASITVCMIFNFSLMYLSFHIHAARCQWAQVMLLLIFISTFAIEFHHSSFYVACSEASERPILYLEESMQQLEQL